MNQYPLWKNLLVLVLVLLGGLYALPNIFGQDPSMEVLAQREVVIDQATQAKVEQALQASGVAAKGMEIRDGKLLVRFASSEDQLKSMDPIAAALGDDYTEALTLSPDLPDWLRALGAEPMYLGLDLRGGIHVLIDVDMESAIESAMERYNTDIRTLLREKKVRYVRVGREGDVVEVKFNSAEKRVDGSYLTFDTGARAPYGFHPTDSVNFVGAVSPGDTVLYNPFSSHGDTLYRSVDLIWNDGTKGLLNYHVTASVHLRYHYLDAPTAIDLDYTITLLNHDGEYDSIPFDGDDQTRRCPPSEFVIYEDVWNFGSFVECTGVPVTLFFPYMPKLISDNLFWSGVSLVNHGGVDFDELTVHIYDENGNLFTADLPGLAQRNQYTWLLINDVDAGVVALFDMTEDANGEFVVPAPANPEVPADSFGQTRMSMFVVGNFEAEFANDVFSGDLDGFLLIGKGGDIDGSYLPRNYDNDIPGQNADLPLLRSKASNNSLRAKVVTSSTPAKYSYTNGLPVNK